MKSYFRSMYLVAVIDVHSRFVVGWDISNSMDADWVVATLENAFTRHGKPVIVNSDQGSQADPMSSHRQVCLRARSG